MNMAAARIQPGAAWPAIRLRRRELRLTQQLVADLKGVNRAVVIR
jgi:hypothetical protein